MGQFISTPISVALTVAFVTITFLLFAVIPLAVSAPVDKLQSCDPPKPPDCFNVCGNTMFYLTSKDTCEPCISCPAGQEPNTYCGDFKGHGENATCNQCKPGFFTTEESQLKCRQCSKCAYDRRHVERQCTTTSDTECGGCIEGYGTHPDSAGTELPEFCYECGVLHSNISSQQESCLTTLQPPTKSSAVQPTTKSSSVQPTTKLYAPQPATKPSALKQATKPSPGVSITPREKQPHPVEYFTIGPGLFRPLDVKQANIDEELSLEDDNLSPANKNGIIIGATFVVIVAIIAFAIHNSTCLKQLVQTRSSATGHCHYHRHGSTEISTKPISSCNCKMTYMLLNGRNGHLNKTMHATPSTQTLESLDVQSAVKHGNIKPFCDGPFDVQTMSTQFTVEPEVELNAAPVTDDGTYKPLDSSGGNLSRDNDSLYTEPAESSPGDRLGVCAPEHDSAPCEKAIGNDSFHADHLISNSYPTSNPPVPEENPNEPKLRVVASEQPEHNSASCEKVIGAQSFHADHLNSNSYPIGNPPVQENNSKLKVLASKPEESQEIQDHRYYERKSLRPVQDENTEGEQERPLIETQDVKLPNKDIEDPQTDNMQQQPQQSQPAPSPPKQQQHQQSSEHQNGSILKTGSQFIFHGSANFSGPIYISNHGQGTDRATDGVSGTHQAPHVPPPSTHRESVDGYVIRQCTDENSTKENKLP